MKLRQLCTLLCLISATGYANTVPVSILHSINEVVVNEAWNEQIERFNKSHDKIEVKHDYLSGEPFKQKLQTMLMSPNKPDLIFTWGGRDYVDRANAGLLADMTDYLPTITKQIPESALDTYRVDGKLYGVPWVSKPTILYYNVELLEQAGVDPSELDEWEGFLGAVEKLKQAGITPLALGAMENWPSHFYFSYLAMRIGGPEVFKKAVDEGFEDPAFLEAAKQLKRLADLKPFQPGYMTADTANAYASFGNKQVAMQLQGEWQYKLQADGSLSGTGVPGDLIGLGRFPAVEGGKGQVTDIISGVDGWAFTNSASKESAEFVDFWLNEENMAQLAADALMLPVNPVSAEAVSEPLMRRMARLVPESTYVHGFVDQILGAHLGGAVNDISTELMGGTITPEDAIATLQDAYDFQ